IFIYISFCFSLLIAIYTSSWPYTVSKLKHRFIWIQYDTIFLAATASPPTRFACMLSVLPLQLKLRQKGNAAVGSDAVYNLNLK
ncbi:MAG: hypothetical protein AAGU75_18590, partial [Bacillota bacterium]